MSTARHPRSHILFKKKKKKIRSIKGGGGSGLGCRMQDARAPRQRSRLVTPRCAVSCRVVCLGRSTPVRSVERSTDTGTKFVSVSVHPLSSVPPQVLNRHRYNKHRHRYNGKTSARRTPSVRRPGSGKSSVYLPMRLPVAVRKLDFTQCVTTCPHSTLR